MKRVALGAAWLAASYSGTVMASLFAVRLQQPWLLVDVAAFAPLALLLVWLVRNRVWAAVIVVGLGALAVAEHLARPLLIALLVRLQPAPSYPPAPLVARLPGITAYYLVYGLIVGLVEMAFLWPYLKPAWMWPVFKVIALPFFTLVLYWRVVAPVPGVPHAGWSWAPSLVGAIAIALLWQFDARAPRLRWPPFRLPLPPEDEEAEPAYAAWMADLERSLE